MSEPEFDWLSLDADEEIVWSAKPHSMSIAPAMAIGIPLSLVLVGIPIVAGAYLWRENTNYVVTTDGLYKKTGVLSRDVQKIDFDKVQNISFSEGVVGNYFGYGNVDISTAGGSGVEMQFTSVADPKSVQELVNKRIKDARRQPDREDGTEKEQVLDEILAELRAMRETFERIEAAESGRGSQTQHETDRQAPGRDETDRPTSDGGNR